MSPADPRGVGGNIEAVTDPVFAAHRSSPQDLQDQLSAERAQTPFIVYRDASDTQQIVVLEGRVRVGRDPGCELCLAEDAKVSRLHAELEAAGDVWALLDHGLSRNGSFVNETRVEGRRALHDGDVLRFGGTHLLFRAPAQPGLGETVVATAQPMAELTDTQRRVLLALCRPVLEGGGYATSASNKEIADEIHLSVDRVKAHLGALYELAGLAELDQRQKRAGLVELALRTGLVTRRELADG